MKKNLAIILTVLLSFALFAGCNTDSDGDEAGSRLTGAEAQVLVQAWLDEHPDMATPYEPTTIAGMSDELYSYDGEEYYFFELSGYDWLDILVHPGTGDMLCIATENSDEPAEPVIEPLADYYDRYYAGK